MTNDTTDWQKSPRASRFPPLQKGGSRGDLLVLLCSGHNTDEAFSAQLAVSRAQTDERNETVMRTRVSGKSRNVRRHFLLGRADSVLHHPHYTPYGVYTL